MKKHGIRYRWLPTSTELAKALLYAEDLAIDDAKEFAWMTLYVDDRDTLEDILYGRLYEVTREPLRSW
jgi:hypothetical protein